MEYDPESAEHRKLLADAILAMLNKAGFTQVSDPRIKAKELIFGREIKDSKIHVLIYTSIVGDAVRAKAKDAIRVTAAYIPKSGKIQPLGKAEGRVYRTGEIEDIAERALGRMREVWGKAVSKENCQSCGAPMILSAKGKLYCADICWKTNKHLIAPNPSGKFCSACGGPLGVSNNVASGDGKIWHLGCYRG